MVAKAASKAPAVEGFNFGDRSAYSSGGGLPEGNYEWTGILVQMFSYTNKQQQSRGAETLGVMITLKSLDDEKAEPYEKFYSLGRNAHQSWAPNDDGTGIVPVAGGPGTPPNNQTNWAILVDSLFDSGMPEGYLANDLTALVGLRCHMANIAEPESRKQMATSTGEAGGEQRKAQTIAVVTEIMEDGRPWEAGAAPKAAGKPNGKPGQARPATTARGVATTATAPAASATEEVDTDEIVDTVLSEVLEGVKTLPRALARTKSFKRIKDAHGDEMANTIVSAVFANDAALGEALGRQGWKLSGLNVVQGK